MAMLEELVRNAMAGDKKAVARLITMVENDEEKAREIVRLVHPHTGKAYVVGITGPPGAGKSTLLDKLIKLARDEGHRVGVIAVDPTSPFTGGALLGDRLRMQRHSTDPDVFIRSMATRGSLGGLAKATNDAIKVLDASGYDIIFVETVGVGQTEVDIVRTADTVVLVLVPGYGDEVQALKAGLMEIADIFAINKADREGTEMLHLEIQMAVEFERDRWRQLGWEPPIVETTAFTLRGVRPLWEAIGRHVEFMRSSGRLNERRKLRAFEEVKAIVADSVVSRVEERLRSPEAEELIGRVLSGKIDPYSAADIVMERFLMGGDGMFKKIDHIGIAVRNLDEAIKVWEGLGLKVDEIEEVPDQKVRTAIIHVGESRIELLEPTSEDSPIAKFIAKRGEGIHHMALGVDDIEATLEHLKEEGYRLIDEKPRIGAGGAKIAFVHPKAVTGVLLELCQRN